MKGTNDDYDDDFEDYENDDFEDDSDFPNKTNSSINNNAAPPKLAAVATIHDTKITNSKYISSSQESTKSDAKESIKLNDNRVNQRNEKMANSVSSSSRIKKFDNMQISFSHTSSDPRTIRIKKLIDSGVLDLQIERFTQCHILPTTKYEFYLNTLRNSTCNLRQTGVPMDLEKRDMNTETDIIENADKSMQFSYGQDDTEFFNLLQDIQLQKKGMIDDKYRNNYDREINKQKVRSNEAIRKTDVELENTTNTPQDNYEQNGMEVALDIAAAISVGEGATRLTSFLQRASSICEGILQDEAEDRILNNNKVKNIRSSEQQQQIFDSDSDWVQLGKDASKGSNEPVRTRRICNLRFSQLQPNLVMSAHPYPIVNNDEEDLDLKPFKGLYSVWDVAYPGSPLYVLEATGQPTCCCFSNTQSHLVIAGTSEGSLHLWDLRENSSFHKDRDSMDLRIDRGIRKPSYSTNLSYLSSSSTQGYTSSASGDANNEPPLDDFQHSAPILQIESLSPYDSQLSVTSSNNSSSSTTMGIISQFVSIDESGLVIFWTTSQTQRTNQDLQCSPWAGVALIQTRQLRHSFHNPNPISPSIPVVVTKEQDVRPNNHTSVSITSNSSGTSLQGKSLLAIIPEDISTILITKSTGAISKLSRFGLPDAPHILRRCHNYSIDIAAVDDSNNSKASVSDSNSNKNNKDKVVVPSTREVNYFSAISCIAVRSPIHDTSISKISIASSGRDSSDMIIESKNNNVEGSNNTATSKVVDNVQQATAALILVGRYDGTVDLFQVDAEHPIQSWDLTSFTISSSSSLLSSHSKTTTTSTVSEKQTSSSSTNSVVLLQWCSNRASVFFAADSNGNIFYFDLNQNPYSPINVDSIKIINKSILHTGVIDISKCVSNTGLFNIIVSVPNLKSEGDSIRSRRGNKHIAKQLFDSNKSSSSSQQQQLLHEEISLRTSLHRLATEKFTMQSVTFVNSNNNHSNLSTSYNSSDRK